MLVTMYYCVQDEDHYQSFPVVLVVVVVVAVLFAAAKKVVMIGTVLPRRE